MNFKITLALVIILLMALSLYLLVQARQNQPKGAENKPATLVSIQAANITTISFSRFGVEALKFARQGNQWRMLAPVDSAADKYTLDSIARSLADLAYVRKFAPDSSGVHSLADTGTAKPQYQVKFSDTGEGAGGGGHEYTLSLGKQGTEGIFATLSGDKNIYVLSSNPLDQLDKPADKFRNLEIKQLPSDKVADVSLQSGDGSWKMSRSGDKWVISEPVSARADAPKADAILTQLQTITAQSFSNLSKKEAGLDPPLASMTVHVREETAPASPITTRPAASQPALAATVLQFGYPTDLTVEKANSPIYASLAGSNEVFVLSADAARALVLSLRNLRDPAITPARMSDATAATFTTAGKIAVNVVKKDGEWTLTSTPTPVEAGDLEVGDWLGDVGNLRAIKFVDDAGNLKSIGLDPPETRIEIAIQGQSQHEVILIGKPETADKVTPMMRQGEPTVYLVQTADAEKVVPTPLSLRDKTIEQLNADDIRSITIAGPAALAGGTQLTRQGTTWKVQSAGKPLPVDDSKMTGLLADFTPLKAASYLAENTAISAPTPDLTVTLTVSSQPESSHPEVPATAPAQSTTPATMDTALLRLAEIKSTAPVKSPTTAPATHPATPPLTAIPLGPQPTTITTRILKLYKPSAKETHWKAIWDGPAPQWTFEPTPDALEHLTRDTYTASTTQPAPPAPAP